MIDDSVFDSSGRYRTTKDDAQPTPDGSHPKSWRGRFVIVLNGIAYRGPKYTDPVAFHHEVLIRTVGRIHSRFSACPSESFNPVLFRTYDDAAKELLSMIPWIMENWVGMESPDNIRDITGYSRLIFNPYGTSIRIAPFFEILDACDYRIQNGKDLSYKRPKKSSGTEKLRPPPSDVASTSDAVTAEKSAKETPKSRPLASTYGFRNDSRTLFFAKDNASGKYLRITKGSGINGATLVPIREATYFSSLDILLEVMSAIERSFWNPTFAHWHLVSAMALLQDGKLTMLRTM